MKKLVLILTVLGLGSSALSALPPSFSRAKELKAVIDSSEVRSHVPVIDSIERTEDGKYTVRDRRCFAVVEVEYKEPQVSASGSILIGPAQVKGVKIQNADCVSTTL